MHDVNWLSPYSVSVCLFKVKSPDVFDIWVCKLRHHRLFRQNEIVRSPRDATLRTFPPSASAESPQNTSSSAHQNKQGKPSNLPWQLPPSCSTGQSKVAAWLQESEEMDKCSEELAYCQSSLLELSQLLQSLEILQRTQSAPNFTDMQVRFMQSDDEYSQSQAINPEGTCAVPLSASLSQVRLHSSNPNLCAELADFQTPVTRLTDSIDSASDYIKLQEDFCIIAQKVHSLLKSAFNTVAIEKEKIKQVLLEQEQTGQSNQIITLRRSLSQALSQNAELKTRLNRIHSESVLSEQVVSVNIISSPDEAGEPLHVGIPLSQQVANESRLSMSESVSEFFDAQEVLLSASSSENEAIVAAFAVSGYSSTYYRAGSKPFNPLLGETYECIREDKGFCFFSEQVSHHPPISACHCESQNFTFWQDVRWKNKFWGKSMEILPIGTVNVMLPSYGDHYEWNKVTTCVHNILSGRRWIEHYGEVTIRNTRNTACICKLTFVK
ncbi:hypothetical protein cypCar_00042272, partial [Cyprinus carpio]